MVGWTKQQILIVITLICGNVVCALCYALQAPFFPKEAESKGATPSQYGWVFGSFEIVMLVSSPFLGQYISVIGTKFSAVSGLFLSAGSMYLFGLLDKFTDTVNFIGFAFAIRIVESLGNCAYFVAFNSFVVMTFPDNPGSVFATLESFYGLGMILGPTLGGMLYTLGGFSFPFTVMAITLLLVTIFAYYALPSDVHDVIARPSFFSTIKIKPIFCMGLAVVSNAYGIGCISVGLEPHLRPLGYTPLQVGFIFVAYGLAYSLTVPLWGRLLDTCLPSYIAIAVGGLISTLAFMFIGPAPYIPIEPTLPLIIIALVLVGIGMGGILVGAYVGSQRDAIINGMPDNVGTFGIISGIWISSLSLGAFLGPSISGYLIEHASFEAATQVIVVLHLVVLVCFFYMEIERTLLNKSKHKSILRKKDFKDYESLDQQKTLITSQDSECV